MEDDYFCFLSGMFCQDSSLNAGLLGKDAGFLGSFLCLFLSSLQTRLQLGREPVHVGAQDFLFTFQSFSCSNPNLNEVS